MNVESCDGDSAHRNEVTCILTEAAQNRPQLPDFAIGEAQPREHLIVEGSGCSLGPLRSDGRGDYKDTSAIDRVARAPGKTLIFESIHGAGDTRGVDLEQVGQPSDGQSLAACEAQNHQDLVARKRQVYRTKCRVDPFEK